MISCATLPESVKDKIAFLERRLIYFRLIRGVSLAAVGLLLSYGFLFLLDWWIGFNTLAMRMALMGWVFLGLVGGFFWLLRPLVRRPDFTALAALIEEKYPEFGERLVSSVQIDREKSHGAPGLIDLLMVETAQRSRPLDFLRALDPGPMRRLAALALLVLVGTLFPIFLWPAYAGFAPQFFLSWSRPLVNYTILASPGNHFVGRGRPATITARLHSLEPEASLPTTCILHYRLADKPPLKVSMQADQRHVFTFTFDRIEEDLEYRVEAGGAASDTYHFQIVEPVQLAAGSPGVQVAPPPYVNRETHPVKKETGKFEWSFVQYSVVGLEFRFTRPAVTGRVLVRSRTDEKTSGPETGHDLVWSEDRRSASLEVPAAKVGSFALVLEVEAEHKIATIVDLGGFSVWADEPPRFLQSPSFQAFTTNSIKAPELNQARIIAPSQNLYLPVTVEDKVGLNTVELEYRINQGDVKRIIETVGGRARCEKEFNLPLADLAQLKEIKDGDFLFFRFKAADNRLLKKGQIASGSMGWIPDGDLTHQAVYEPTPEGDKERWFAFKIQGQADPLEKQEVLAQHKDLRLRLETIKKKIESTRGKLQKTRVTLNQVQFLHSEHLKNLAEVRGENGAIREDLENLALQAAVDPFAKFIADLAFSLSGAELNRSEQALARAQEKVKDSGPRDQSLYQADQELGSALKKLEEFLRLNEQMAQERLDLVNLERLVRKEKELALEAAKLAELARENPQDPMLKDALAKLKAEQESLAQELQRLEKSKLFQQALEKARQMQAQDLAIQARNLGEAQNNLNEAMAQTRQEELKNLLGELAKKQRELAGKIDRLADQVVQDKPAFPVPKFPEPRQAADDLDHGLLKPAFQNQDQTMAKLLDLARELENSLVFGRDPRLAFQKLNQFQEQIRKDLVGLQASMNKLSVDEVLTRLKEIAKAEKSLQASLAKVEIRPDLKEALQERKALLDLTGHTADLIATDPAQAYPRILQIMTDMKKLIQQLPERDPTTLTAEEKHTRGLAQNSQALAKEQKDLQEAIRKLLAEHAQKDPEPASAQPVEKWLQMQEEIVRQIGELAQKISPTDLTKKAHQAQEMARETREQAQAGAFSKAGKAGEKTARSLEDLAKKLEMGDNTDSAKGARSLAQQQDFLNKKWAELDQNLAAQKALQLARQKQLQEETHTLAQEMLQLSQKLPGSGLGESAKEVEMARKAMEQSQAMKNTPEKNEEAVKEAAMKLQMAGQKAADALQAMVQKGAAEKTDASDQAMAKTGQAFQQGQKQMTQAQDQLAKTQPGQAMQNMEKAAAAMNEAAQNAKNLILTRSGLSGGNNPFANVAQGPKTGTGSKDLPGGIDLMKYGARSWGELPGDLRTRLVQDMRARYGDEYARIIQSYFEQIADTKKSP